MKAVAPGPLIKTPFTAPGAEENVLVTSVSIVSTAVVAAYLFAVLPSISNIEMLIAVLAPSFILFGILLARPATALIGMALGIITATLLALQSTYSADFAALINSSVSLVIGMATAAVGIKLMRSVGAEWSARR